MCHKIIYRNYAALGKQSDFWNNIDGVACPVADKGNYERTGGSI